MTAGVSRYGHLRPVPRCSRASAAGIDTSAPRPVLPCAERSPGLPRPAPDCVCPTCWQRLSGTIALRMLSIPNDCPRLAQACGNFPQSVVPFVVRTGVNWGGCNALEGVVVQLKCLMGVQQRSWVDAVVRAGCR